MRKLLSLLGIGMAANTAASAPPYAPYAESSANFIYNLLFCDDLAAFRPATGRLTSPFVTIFAEPLDISALEKLAGDATQEGRIRYLAFSRLRAADRPVRPKVLLGVIVEFPVAQGHDVLAAYSEGGVRYINYTGKLAVLEGVTEVQPLVQQLFTASQPLLDRIGPWDKPRLPPPNKPASIRLTFLVSDGLYFGQGPREVMQREAISGPVISGATALLQAVVRISLQSPKPGVPPSQ